MCVYNVEINMIVAIRSVNSGVNCYKVLECDVYIKILYIL